MHTLIRLILLCLSFSVSADSGTKQELGTVRTEIKNTEKNLDNDRLEVKALQLQLREQTLRLNQLHNDIRKLAKTINFHESEIKRLRQQRYYQQTKLSGQQTLFSKQIRVAYMNGSHDYLKLLLNQEDPNQFGRNLMYHRYIAEARSQSMDNLDQSIEELTYIETAILQETDKLHKNREQHKQQYAALEQQQSQQKQLAMTIQSRIGSGESRLKLLQEDEQRLSKLLFDLQQQALAKKQQATEKPFNKLKGKLQWPLTGKVLKQFGSKRKQGNLKWQGLLISAKTGTDVKSIAAGKVVFADWFRNMGLLIIIDHGKGYMSLYGHNQALYSRIGDTVRSGQTIAGSGANDGGEFPGLYFEIRTQGKPNNPARWLAKH